MDILKEMRRLHALGWAIHWIRPNSKAPVDSGWTTGERKTIEALAKQYKVGMGVGVRLGKASKITGNRYLCNIDIDIKSSDSRHRKEALAALEKVYPGLRAKAPTVKTGYGLRLFCATKKPVASGKIAQSKDQIKVYMPTAPINRRQELAVKQGLLTQKELEKGYRARPAWELELMSEGRQVVLPPSIHPETKERYEWLSDYDLSPFAIPFIEVLNVENVGGRPSGSTMLNKFTPVEDVSLDRLPVFIRKMITDGEGVQDRSADCYKVSIAMLKDDYTV